MRGWLFALVAGLTFAAASPAQTQQGWRFQWKSGQVLNYRVENSSKVVEMLPQAFDPKQSKERSTLQKVDLIERWQVLSVDDAGIATIQKSVPSLRIEQTTFRGEILVFDSNALDKSDPQMRKGLEPMVGTPLAVLRIDGRGHVVEVKECKVGTPSKYEQEAPFTIELPEKMLEVGEKWERAFVVHLDPPQGTGEKYAAVQRCEVKSLPGPKNNGPSLVAGFATTLKTLPKALADQIPLLHLQAEGEAVFNTANGRLDKAHMQVNKQLKDHQGEGSSFSLEVDFRAEYVEGK